MSVQVLVYSYFPDAHAAAVAWALERAGATVTLWSNSDFPQKASGLLNYDLEAEATGRIGDATTAFTGSDVVWFRRTAAARLPDSAHAADRHFIELEWRDFVMSAQYLSAENGAFAVNPPASFRHGNLKPLQLHWAKQVGFRIPPTLVTSDPEAVQRFTERQHRAIFKTMNVVGWEDPAGQKFAVPTTELQGFDETYSESVRLAPGIYQAYVEKDFEVRVTVFGQTVVAVRIDSQSDPRSQVDFRLAWLVGQVKGDPITIPDEIRRRTLDLMRRMGVIYAAMDFIVTPTGEWVFLESNNAGQFLWLEETWPELPVLDMFVQFLLARRSDFEYAAGESPRLRLADYEASDAWPAYATRSAKHVQYESPAAIQEQSP